MTVRHVEQALTRYRREVDQARELLEFAVSQGRAVDERIAAAILRAEDLSTSLLLPSVEERTSFEVAYRDLAAGLSPVTLETLHATSSDYPCRSIFSFGWPTSEAKIWSRKLWFATAVIVFVILFTQDLDKDQAARYQPFLFGGLGALTYLLRACHEYIHKREFDPKRVPEYYNRLLLGLVGGGAMLLFENLLPKDKVTPNAIAFLVGYNTDLLFSTLERIANAIFPKIGSDLTAPAAATQSSSTSSSTTTSAGEVCEERVQKIQKFLLETERPQYDVGSALGMWDERTKAAVVAFLVSNYEAIPAYQSAAASPDFGSMDKEALIAQMSNFIAPQTSTKP